LTNRGIQPQALMQMIDKLKQPRDPKHDYYAGNIWDVEQQAPKKDYGGHFIY